MSIDSGRGGIVPNKKNISAINDTLLLGRITSVRHANGRDWWVIVHKYFSDIYYKLLFTPNGVFGPYIQQIGSVIPPKLSNGNDNDIAGMACFSPNGEKYAMVSINSTIEYLNFDRCSGQFIQHQTIQIPDSSNTTLSCAFSPNSQYLYVNSLYSAYQYDTDASIIQNSSIKIAQYDGFINPFPTWFFLQQLAPNGKIYVSTYNGTHKLHVIENPDSAGLSCNFIQHGLGLPNNLGDNKSMPNFPNYRIGKLVGSPCDTLTSLKQENTICIAPSISPNPTIGNFTLQFNTQPTTGIVQVYNINSKLVLQQNIAPYSQYKHLNITNLPQGIYLCKLKWGNVEGSVKVIKE